MPILCPLTSAGDRPLLIAFTSEVSGRRAAQLDPPDDLEALVADRLEVDREDAWDDVIVGLVNGDAD